jgi:DNA ligase-1
MNESYVTLAHKYEGALPTVCVVSQKLDGMRAWWDGGVSRGVAKGLVGYANNSDASKRNHVSTGLWSRAGNVIHAPASWLDQLPIGVCLDGELMGPEGSDREQLFSIVRSYGAGDTRWSHVRYLCYDAPPLDLVIRRRIVTAGRDKVLVEPTIRGGVVSVSGGSRRHETWAARITHVPMGLQHEQWTLPAGGAGRVAALTGYMGRANTLGWEGLMIRDAAALYMTTRTRKLLKWKINSESSGVVVGTTAGLGRLDGMIGALVVREDKTGCVFELAGLSDLDRSRSPSSWIGTKVSFVHRGRTAAGVPCEARYNSEDPT